MPTYNPYLNPENYQHDILWNDCLCNCKGREKKIILLL